VLACARSTGFLRRAGGKIDPWELLFALVFRGMTSVPVGLGLLTAFLDCLVSRPGLHARFNERAVKFFRQCLGTILLKRLSKGLCINTKLTSGFSEILILDSTSWDVPEHLQWIFPGSGGSASKANCKLQFCYDYKTGEFRVLEDTAGSLPDQKYSRNIGGLIKKGGLVIFDLGYWAFNTFLSVSENGGFFLSRLNTQANLWIRKGEEFAVLDLPALLAGCSDRAIETAVCLRKGKDTIDVRVAGWRVPEEVANLRRMKLRENARKKGRTASKRCLFLCDWSIFITNANEEMLPAGMMRTCYRIRWNVELVFKSWKSILRIHRTNVKKNEHRLKCELYAKMILAVIVHRIHQHVNSHLWAAQKRELSIDKLWKFIDSWKETLCEAAKRGARRLAATINGMHMTIARVCEKLHQKSRTTTLQKIDEMLGDPLPAVIELRQERQPTGGLA
jgi:hypothetical protein